MAGATSVIIREEVVSSSKGVGHNWAPSTDKITPHQVPSHRRVEAGKGVVSELKLHTSGSSDSNAEKGNPAGTTLKKEDARELTSHSPSFGSSPFNQDKPSLSSLGGVKPVLVLTRIKDGCFGELADPSARERAIQGDGEEDKMEFEGASDGSTSK